MCLSPLLPSVLWFNLTSLDSPSWLHSIHINSFPDTFYPLYTLVLLRPISHTWNLFISLSLSLSSFFLSIDPSITAAKSLQSCPTLCDHIDGSPPGSPVPGILQARTLEWVAISFSNAWKWKVKVKSLSRVWLLETPWTAAYEAPRSMGFSRQEYWSGVPLPSPHPSLRP